MALEAGRELDALVAEKVMGWRKFFDGSEPWVNPADGKGYRTSEIPPYSRDIAAAWTVVEHMQAADWAIILDNTYNYLGCWQAQFERSRDEVFNATADTAPLAIALAALRAVGVSVD